MKKQMFIAGGIALAMFLYLFLEVSAITRDRPGIDQVLNQTWTGWFMAFTMTGKIAMIIFLICFGWLLTLPFRKK